MRLLALTLAALVSGCATLSGSDTMQGIMSSWVGASVDEVLRQWGYPHAERTFAGRSVLVWERNGQAVMPTTATTTGTVNRIGSTAYVNAITTYSPNVINYSCTRMLEISPDNIVVGYEWKGNSCPFLEVMEFANWRRK